MNGNEIVTVPGSTLLDGPANDEADRLTDSLMSSLEVISGALNSLPVAPTSGERKLLNDRLFGIKRQMRPLGEAGAEKERLKGALGMLFGGYTSLMNANAANLVAAHMMHLQDLPIFAVLAAIDDIRHNRVKDLDLNFAPSSAQIYAIAEEYVKPLRAKSNRIMTVLAARISSGPPPSAEFRERAAAQLRELAAAMRVAAAERELAEKAARVERLEKVRAPEEQDRFVLREYARLGMEPVYANGLLVSPGLLESITNSQVALGEARARQDRETADRTAYKGEK